MDLNFSFRNQAQRDYFWSKKRNNLFSGGFGNGKTYAGMMRAVTHCVAFDNYRMVIGRDTFKELTETTMVTFLKVCPEYLLKEHKPKDGYTEFINGSVIYWKHLDVHDEQSLRGLEINSGLIDQAEEMEEAIFLVLDMRIGRWDLAKPSKWLLEQTGGIWPQDANGKYLVPNYLDLLCNPDTFFHWIYRTYHPDSPTRDPECGFFHGETDASMNDVKTMQRALGRDPEWVAKYVKGEWGASLSAIHNIAKESFIPYDKNFLTEVLAKGALYMSMDHGNSAPTCVLWIASYKGVYIFYREYYVADAVISRHRQNIADLTTSQEYILTKWADPSIFTKTGQKEGAFWTVADEYLTSEIPGPSITWIAADNNEFGTRNRINELLAVSDRFKHPVTGQFPAPGIYFLQSSPEYPQGIARTYLQIGSQRKVLLGTDNGKAIYGDERDESIEDHAYDAFRYFVAMHGSGLTEKSRVPPVRSIETHIRYSQKTNALRSRRTHLL